MADGREEAQEIEALVNLVKEFNAKWDGTNRLTRLTLILAIGDETVALLEGPPVRSETTFEKKSRQ